MTAEAIRYLELRARMERLVAAEDRAFVRYMEGTGSAATARKARSRVNALDHELVSAKWDLYKVMDAAGDSTGDLDAFAAKATA